MSREERRNYERMMKNMERGPALPAAAKARAERQARRRGRAAPAPRGAFSTRFWVRTVLIALVVGFVAFSLQWSNGMPAALYVGLAAGGGALALLLGLQLVQRRGMTERTQGERPPR